MTNHIHLLASPDTEKIVPKMMQSVGRRYVQHFNFSYKRTGTLWEGRYRATIVDAENYLFECMRYIELNPVRVGMVRHPRLAKEENQCRSAYRELVKAPMDAELLDEIRDSTNKGWALGSGRFQEKVERLTERRTTPLPKGRPKRGDSE